MRQVVGYTIIGALCLLGGCYAPKLDCEYIIRPWVQHSDKGKADSLYTLVSWAIDADTTSWCVASYSDAVAGIITNKTTGETRRAETTGFKDSSNWSAWFRFVAKPVIIIVADSDRPFYAYHEAILYGGTPTVKLSITEQTFRSDTTLRQGVWHTVY